MYENYEFEQAIFYYLYRFILPLIVAETITFTYAKKKMYWILRYISFLFSTISKNNVLQSVVESHSSTSVSFKFKKFKVSLLMGMINPPFVFNLLLQTNYTERIFYLNYPPRGSLKHYKK